MEDKRRVAVFAGEELAQYGFGEGHPFGPDRYHRFFGAFQARGLPDRVMMRQPAMGTRDQLEAFHTPEYVNRIRQCSSSGRGYLDAGDTPAFEGIYEAALTVVGTVLAAVDGIMHGEFKRAFVPIAGLHHARRDSAAGFCAVNDCGIAIETLRRVHGIRKVAYVDIDAHHGDGVFYSFESDPDQIFADIHEDGQFLYPGTGSADETGKGLAKGTKLNIPLLPHSDDEAFRDVWPHVETYLESACPEFILFQCGADSLAGDPITHLNFTNAAHRHAAESLSRIADRLCDGRVLAMGGGGYNRTNLEEAWTAVIEGMIGKPGLQPQAPEHSGTR